MTSVAAVRVWILAVGLGSFAAGMVVGSVVPEMLAADREPDVVARNARRIAERYELTAEQERQLLLVLQEDRRLELEILESAEWDQLPPELRSRWLAAQRRTEQRIRFVLDERQRTLYDRDSRPSAGAADPR